MNPGPGALVLVVEDDVKIAGVLRDYLVAAGYQAEIIGDGREAVVAARERGAACMLLDVNLPGMNGIEVCRQVRAFSHMPIAMVTARADEIDRLLGLDTGADDYVCKPFSPREVVARVRVMLRRVAGQSPRTATPVQVDAGAMRISVSGRALDLTPAEYHLMAALVAHAGRVRSRAQLAGEASRDRAEMSERTVDSHVRNLRRKLQACGIEAGEIRSVHGVGYAWEPA